MKSSVRIMAAALDNFCDVVGWRLIQYATNPNNKTQLYAEVCDEEANKIFVIATSQGNFYKLLGNKKKELINQKEMIDARKEQKIQ